MDVGPLFIKFSQKTGLLIVKFMLITYLSFAENVVYYFKYIFNVGLYTVIESVLK